MDKYFYLQEKTKMSELQIILPRIDEAWMEENLYQLISEGIELLHLTRPDCIAMSIECTEFGEVFNDLDDYSYNNYYEGYPPEYQKAEKESDQCIRYLFQDYNLWNKDIVTKEDIDDYNEVLREAVFQISERFAIGWCEFLGLPFDRHLKTEAIA